MTTWLSSDGAVRVRIARTGLVIDDARRRHALSPYATVGLGRALTAAALIPMTWKDADRVSVQWTGVGPLRSLVVEVRRGGAVRGYVGEPGALPPRPFRRSPRPLTVGKDARGLVVVTRQAETGVHAQGQILLYDGSVDGDLERWFTASEQVPTRLRVDEALDEEGGASRIDDVVGVLAQALPGPRGQSATEAGLPDLEAMPSFAGALDDAIIAALLPGARHLDTLALSFACPCSRARTTAGVAMLTADELAEMIDVDRGAEVRCEFCAERYAFTADDLERILATKRAENSSSGEA